MKRLFFLIFLLFSGITLAHTPVCRCELEDSDVIYIGQFHDGSEAADIPITVFDANNLPLIEGQFNKQSRFLFTIPQPPFYIIMDAGPGEMFEVDSRDILGIEKHASS